MFINNFLLNIQSHIGVLKQCSTTNKSVKHLISSQSKAVTAQNITSFRTGIYPCNLFVGLFFIDYEFFTRVIPPNLCFL